MMAAGTLPRPAGPARLHVWLAVAVMLLSLALTQMLRPTRYLSDVDGKPDLEHLVPARFGDWEQSAYGAGAVVNPQQQEALDALYDTTLGRIYVHKPTGRRLMLS